VWDHGVVSVEHDSGAIATLSYALFAPPADEHLSFSVLGDEGRLDIAFKAGTITCFPSTVSAAAETYTVPDPGHPSQPYPGSYEQIRAFVNTARTGEAPTVDAMTWKRVMSVCNAARHSMDVRECVPLH